VIIRVCVSCKNRDLNKYGNSNRISNKSQFSKGLDFAKSVLFYSIIYQERISETATIPILIMFTHIVTSYIPS
jgi:hypothetical protein